MNDLSRMFATGAYDPLVGFPLLAAGVLVAIAWTSDVPPGWREASDVRRWTAIVAAVLASWSLGVVVDRSTDSLATVPPVAGLVAAVVVALPMTWLALASRPTLVSVAAIALVVVASPTDPTDVAAWADVVAWTTTAWWARGARPRLTRVGAAAAVLVGATLTHLTWGTAVAASRGIDPELGALAAHAASGPWGVTLVLALLAAAPPPRTWTLAAPARKTTPRRDVDAIVGPVAKVHVRTPRALRPRDVGGHLTLPTVPSELQRRGVDRRIDRSMPTPRTEALAGSRTTAR